MDLGLTPTTELLAMLFAGLVALGGIVAFLLHTGPVSLDFMTPHLEAMLNEEDGGFVVDIDRTVAVWAGWRDPFWNVSASWKRVGESFLPRVGFVRRTVLI